VTSATYLPPDAVHITTDPHTEPFWEAAKQRRLVAMQCRDCNRFRMPPTPFCPQCRSTAVAWPELSGRGVVYSFSVVHGLPQHPDVTLLPVIVDLPDAPGARLVSNVVDVDPAAVEIGAELTVDFVPISDGYLYPVFRLAR
jgi:uncharacterized OB-fold protein